MSVLLVVLATLTAGGLGSVIRFVVLRYAPIVGLHTVNVLGTVLLAVTVALLNAGRIGWTVAVVLGVGFSGALTTFSTWIAVIDEYVGSRPVRTALRDIALPVSVAVSATVVTFVVIS